MHLQDRNLSNSGDLEETTSKKQKILYEKQLITENSGGDARAEKNREHLTS